MVALNPTQADYDQLFRDMPLAEEHLKTIILTRMVRERDIEIASLRESTPETADQSQE